jgi:hypothetical protein
MFNFIVEIVILLVNTKNLSITVRKSDSFVLFLLLGKSLNLLEVLEKRCVLPTLPQWR